MSKTGYLHPDWPAPDSVSALVTLRSPGASVKPYDSFNLAAHVGDATNAVEANRAQLRSDIQIERTAWLNQVHGVANVHIQPSFDFSSVPEADASWTELQNVACTVLTADCIPVLVCNTRGTKVAAIHAGWRGLSKGVIAKCLADANFKAGETLVWLGPAIGRHAFQVGEDVRQHFRESEYFTNIDINQLFEDDSEGKLLCNLAELARTQLYSLGYQDVWGGNECTHTEKDRYFSYRRDGQTGRMASLIWLQ